MQKKNTSSKKQRRKVRSGDKVTVIAGNSRGQTGVVLKCLDNDRVLVQGVNMRKKHVKPTQENPTGSILDIERPIHISNIQVCDEKGNPVKLKAGFNKEGEKVYTYQNQGKEVQYRPVKKPHQK